MKKDYQQTDFDIIQIGYGPVSKVSALLLERMGWKVGVFERWGEVFPLPRAVCIDHEVFRMLHAAGLGPIVDKVTSDAPPYKWFNADWQELLSIDWPKGSVSGGSEVNFVHQPTLEKELDAEVKRRNNITVFFEHEFLKMSQTSENVSATVKDMVSGKTKSYTAKYLLGIDGANSTVREQLGITRTDLGFDADWLVVDYVLNDGLTANDLGLVPCGQYCNPERPTTIVPGGYAEGKEYRRWEFMRLPHETKEEMVELEKVNNLLEEWIKPEQGQLIRHSLYSFRSLVTDKWRQGRVLLAGDAAHLIPPFMGQGMCSGMRDVWNLSWKLDRVLRKEATDVLLDSYEAERKPHITEVVKLSMFLGSIICIPDKAEAAKRDAEFLSENPPKMRPFPKLTDGIIAKDSDDQPLGLAGQLSPHGVVRHQRRTGRLDLFTNNDNFKLIVSNSSVILALSNEAINRISLLNIDVIKIAERSNATDEEYADTQGQILSFMKSNNVETLLVRPDHYIFGASSQPDELDDLFSQLEYQLEELT